MPRNASLKHKATNDQLFEEIRQDILALYPDGISEVEAAQSARNLIGFCRIMLEVNKGKMA